MDRNGQLIYEAKGYNNSAKVFDGHSGNGRGCSCRALIFTSWSIRPAASLKIQNRVFGTEILSENDLSPGL